MKIMPAKLILLILFLFKSVYPQLNIEMLIARFSVKCDDTTKLDSLKKLGKTPFFPEEICLGGEYFDTLYSPFPKNCFIVLNDFDYMIKNNGFYRYYHNEEKGITINDTPSILFCNKKYKAWVNTAIGYDNYKTEIKMSEILFFKADKINIKRSQKEYSGSLTFYDYSNESYYDFENLHLIYTKKADVFGNTINIIDDQGSIVFIKFKSK